MTDKELYELCKKFGSQTLEARRKFAGLLPEVFKRELYIKKGFSSIFEFAAKLAGMSREQVNLVLRLERKFEDKPILRRALVEGAISVNKLVKITSIATAENQTEIFEKMKNLSNRAVEVFARDMKRWNENTDIEEKNDSFGQAQFENQNGSNKPLFDHKTMHVHYTRTQNVTTLQLAPDVEKELLEMQEKGIDVNTFLRQALQKRKEEIEQTKLEISQEQVNEHESNPYGRMGAQVETREGKSTRREEKQAPKDKTNIQNQESIPSRYISAKINKILHEEHGTKCSVPGCNKPSKVIHHTIPFALTKTHDPRFLAPLCEEHHEIAHKINLKYMEKCTARKKLTLDINSKYPKKCAEAKSSHP